MIKIVGTKEVLEIISLFMIVVGVGFLLAIAAVKTSSVGILIATLSSPSLTILSYALDIALFLIIVMIIVRRRRHHSESRVLFKFLEAIVIAFTSFFMFLLLLAIFLPQFGANSYDIYAAAAMAISLVLLKNEFPLMKNIATMLSSIGVGVILGFNFSFVYALIIMGAFAIYDYIAVFRSSEMVSVARELSEMDIAFLISAADLESVSKENLREKEIREDLQMLKADNEDKTKRYRNIIAKGRLPVMSQVSLGEGDLSMPLMLVISAYSSLSNPLISIMLVVGAISGIVMTMYFLKRYKMPLPAMPPLFAAACVFTGLAFIVTDYTMLSIAVSLMIIGGIVMMIDAAAIVKRRRRSFREAREDEMMLERKRKAALGQK